MTASETRGYVPFRPDKDGPLELDGILCYHIASRCSSQGPGGVQDNGPRHLHDRGEVIGAEEEHIVVGGGTDVDPGGFPCP